MKATELLSDNHRDGMSGTTNQVAIEILRLTKRFGNFTAVDDLTLTVNYGEIFGLLG